jgi:hypothetical protein
MLDRFCLRACRALETVSTTCPGGCARGSKKSRRDGIIFGHSIQGSYNYIIEFQSLVVHGHMNLLANQFVLPLQQGFLKGIVIFSARR